MSTIGLPASQKTPGIYLAVILGGPGTSGGIAPKTTLLQGNSLVGPLTGTAPAFSVAAGTQAVNTPVFLASSDDAGAYFGRGSELHMMALDFFAQYPSGSLYGEAVAEPSSGAVAASLICTFATSPTAAFTVRVRSCGFVFDVGVDGTVVNDPTKIATAVATAILAEDTLPFTAQVDATSGIKLVLTAKQKGPRGNTLCASLSFVNAAGLETAITSSSTLSGAGTTAMLSWASGSIVAVDGEYFFNGGTTQDDFANALAAVASTRYDRIVASCIDATNVGKLRDHLNLYASATAQHWQQGVVGSIDSLATARSLATGINASRVQVVWHYNSPRPIWAVAAQVCAARLIGDGVTGGARSGEVDDPAANLDGIELATALVQRAIADRPLASEIEDALNHGLTPLAPSQGRPGYVTITRSVTSRCMAGGVPNYAVLDTSNVTVCDDGADFLRAELTSAYPDFKLAPDSSDGLPPRAPRVTSPRLIRAFIAGRLKLKEEEAAIINVDANLPLLTVSSPSTGRVDLEIPYEPIPGLHILGGNVRQLS